MNKKFQFITQIEFLLLVLVFSLFSYYYYHLDFSLLLDKSIFPFDSAAYKKISETYSLFHKMPPITNPFHERILFPIVCAMVSKVLQLRLIDAYALVNVISTFFVILIFFHLTFKFKIKALWRWSCTLSYLMFWGSP